MHFENLSELFFMGGYGAYVWSAYGITFLALFILVWNSVSTGKKTMKEIKAKQARQARIEAAKNLENTL
ncbi:heme exporter protein CcmD [Vibrio sp. JC009]|uniref:heme exporter protein CcmD n=1 Tax=Vibrio sp. JC009 TaxID=2912314 RepID=UPI0023B06E80|nr:heme exporter protein CcmD [Vibrio sp. JC009]WED21035.1 heme exporter protein CcmD [Vibrio sp. JC009]